MSTLITNTLQGINTIKYDANTTALTVGSDGTLTINQTPIQKCISFRAGIASNPAIGGATSPIPYSNVTDSVTGGHNIGGHWSTSDYKFTVPRTGVYHFAQTMLAQGYGSGDVLEVYIMREDADGSNDDQIAIGARTKYEPNSTGYSGYLAAHVEATTFRTAGEKVYFSAYRTGSTGTVHNNDQWSYCHGYYIGSA